MVDIATLGIKVDSSGATKASTDLEKLSVSAKDASKSVDQLGVSSTKAGAQVQTNSQRIAQAVQQNSALETSTRRLGTAHENLGHHAHVVESGLHSMGAAAGAQVGPLFGLSATTVRAAASMQEFEFKSSQLRTGLRLLRPLATEAGGSLGHLGLLAGAARGGLVALAAVIAGTVAIALERASDKARVLQGELSDMFGKKAGAAGFEALEGVAKRTGTEIGLMADAFKALGDAQQASDFAKGFRFAPGQIATETKKASEAMETLIDLFKIGGAGSDKAASSITTFFKDALKATDQLGHAGVVTKDIFDKLYADSPRVGRALSEAFSGGDIQRLRERLEYMPIPVKDLIRELQKMGPAVRDEFEKTPKTVEQSLDSLKADFGKLMEEIGTHSGIKFATNLISGMRDFIKGNWNWSDVNDWFNAGAEGSAAAMRELGLRLGNWIWEGIKSSVREGWSSLWSGLTAPTQGAQSPESAPGGASDLTRNVVNKYKDAFAELGQSTDKLADKAIADAARISAAANGSDYGTSTGVTVGANATGGIYKMPGAGLSDSIRLSGRVSPGETVAIIPADKMSGSLLAQLHDTIGQSPINIGPGGSQISAPSSYSAQEARAGMLAMHITVAQQAQARARIAANAMSTSGGTASGFGGGGSGVGGGGFGGPSAFKEWSDRGGNVNPNAGYGGAPALVSRIAGARAAAARAAPLGLRSGSAFKEVGGLGDLGAWAAYFGATNAAMSAPFDLGGPSSFDQSVSSNFFDPYSAYAPGGAYSDQYGATYSAPDYSSFSWDGGPLPGDTSGSLFSDLGGPDIYAGAFARGGSFRVPNRGRGGVDGTSVGMRVNPGETVSVESNEERIGGDKKSSTGMHIENINIVTPGQNPMASLSRNAIRRELSAWMR